MPSPGPASPDEPAAAPALPGAPSRAAPAPPAAAPPPRPRRASRPPSRAPTRRAARAAGAADSRATLRVHAERDARDEAPDFLAAGLVAHVGFADGGQPFVIPMTYQASPDHPRRIYLHGAHHSRLMAHLAAGEPVCVAVTLVDGLVYSRTALYHSVNYRSVVVFARAAAEQPDAAEQRRLFEEMVARYFPGRTAGVHYAPIPDAHLDATVLVALEVEEWSAKARRGGPKGPSDADPSAPGTAGVVELGEARRQG